MKKIIVANWKMTPSTIKEVEKFLEEFKKKAPKIKNTEVVICPSHIHLAPLADGIKKYKSGSLKPVLGSQDFFWENPKGGGSYTGEVSIDMLKNVGVKYVIVGHSERRRYFNAKNEVINKKIKIALKNNLKVLFCVGETERDEHGKYLKFVKKEILEALEGISRKDLKNLTICYEPVWAISSNKGAKADKSEAFLEASIYIRRILFLRFGRKIADEMPVLYGGSVNDKNASEFLDEGNAAGLLIGRASWKPKSFIALLKSIV